VARKPRGQIVQVRLRENSTAKSDRVGAAKHEQASWLIIDEEPAKQVLKIKQ
jgi:hypothetical protein